jgi:hypothetical protein
MKARTGTNNGRVPGNTSTPSDRLALNRWVMAQRQSDAGSAGAKRLNRGGFRVFLPAGFRRLILYHLFGIMS